MGRDLVEPLHEVWKLQYTRLQVQVPLLNDRTAPLTV